MPRYLYIAKKSPHDIVEEAIEAESEQAVLKEISRRGYFPLRVELTHGKKKRLNKPLFRRKRIPIGELAIFSRQLGDLLGAGLPLFRALTILRDQMVSSVFRDVLDEIHQDIKDGQSLSKAVQRQKTVFPPIFGNMIHSGEVGGFLEKVLEELADYSEKEQEIRERVGSALIYPAIISLVGIVSVVAVMIFVVPMMESMFEDLGQRLPLLTRILIASSGYMRDYWWAGLIVLGALVGLVRRLGRSPEGRIAVDRWKLKIPLLGHLLLQAEISRFARMLGALLTNGVPMLKSLEVVHDNLKNFILKRQILHATEEIKRGGSLGHVLKNNPYFPYFVSNMILVGEESGHIDQTLVKIATAYDKVVDRAVQTLTKMLEPILILCVAAVVLVIVIAIVLPLFEMNALIG